MEFAPGEDLYFSIISCIFAEALDRNGLLFLINCFQNISNKLGVPLSEETNEGLVKYFYAPQMGVCLVTVSKLHHCAAYQRTCVHVVYFSSWKYKISRIGMEILQTFSFIQIAQEQRVVV